ncbi:T9SS type A sorting domain-containing protein [Aureisphaera sp. CAU 1614]|uniref:T9SS type A sorting domain-containing protein n=1 Tax=Halomarinibacterium sedimenti TaxID=2857106 RepID=A0A9X1JX00_9FLAO|nr:FG-GAP-like repeat-containing protein [Halomarinibacterium sedimenti]MBW2937578.1 T9SS type A sorting domain-containing protein [Halomarinibacterium sedimenti]
MKTKIFSFFILFSSIQINVYSQFQEHTINTNQIVNAIVLADIDDDTDNDILITGNEDNVVKWIENLDGAGDFSIIHVIYETPFNVGNEIVVSDVDLDNDLDILANISSYDCGSVYLFNNIDGNGSYGFETNYLSTCGIQNAIVFADIDGDNDGDWVSSVSLSELNESKLSWFKNNSLGDFEEQIIDASYLRSFELVDFDNDSDIDIIGFNLDSTTNPEIIWYENIDGLGDFSKHIITINQGLDYYSKLLFRDIDSDDDFDIILAHDNILSWYKNDGLGNFGFELIINNSSFTKVNILTVDLDSDGNLDIISSGSNNSINFYKNDGQGNFTRLSIIEDLYRSRSPIFVDDINNDGLQDIIAYSTVNNQISWYENSGIFSINNPIKNEFIIHPNPIKDIILIESNFQILEVEIYNLHGVLLYNRSLDISEEININISSLTEGIYFIKAIDNENNSTIKKIIKI